MRYDPQLAPVPAEWLALPESERLEAVRRHHKRKLEVAGSLQLHATIHAAVETQLAEGHPGATAAMERLLGEGLDRHDAIHAIGSVLAEQMFGILKGQRAYDAAAYERNLRTLTASGWRAEYGE